MIAFKTDDNPSPKPGEHGVIVPIRIEGKAALLGFLKEALHFPAYFGHNWDSLEECLNDATVMGTEKTVLIHHDLPLAHESSEQQIYLRILGLAATDSTKLDVVFPESSREYVTRALTCNEP